MDFFYRINILPIALPPLRERREDIPLLVDHFLKSCHRDGERLAAIPENVVDALCKHDWPGNIRELQNVMCRYVTVKRLDFMTHVTPVPADRSNPAVEEVDLEGLGFHSAMESFQKILISRALDRSRWQKGKAANILGIDRKTLFRKMKCLGLN
jgi:transcriptional regulator with PAS, ATPase and Fis domain